MRKSGSHLSTGHRFYAYDEAGRVLGEYDANGDAFEEYVYLDGFRPVALVRNIGLTLVADIYPILTDHLGTPRKVLDDTGAPQWSWDAKDPYGHQMPDELAGGSTFVFNLRFPGQRYDSETGLYHNGFQDYNPATGKYVQADPIGLAGGWNPYAYVGANPINGIDPDGLIKRDANGTVIFNPTTDTAIEHCQAKGTRCAKLIDRLIYTDKGRKVRARKFVSGDKGFEQNCHDYAFDVPFWIEDAKSIYEDEYIVSNRRDGDLAHYSTWLYGTSKHSSKLNHDSSNSVSEKWGSGDINPTNNDLKLRISLDTTYYRRAK